MKREGLHVTFIFDLSFVFDFDFGFILDFWRVIVEGSVGGGGKTSSEISRLFCFCFLAAMTGIGDELGSSGSSSPSAICSSLRTSRSEVRFLILLRGLSSSSSRSSDSGSTPVHLRNFLFFFFFLFLLPFQLGRSSRRRALLSLSLLRILCTCVVAHACRRGCNFHFHY